MKLPLALLAFSLFCQTSARAVVAFSSFGPAESYDTEHGNAVYGSYSTGGSIVFSVADPFTCDLTGELASVDVALSFLGLNGGTGEASVYLYQNDPTTGLPSTEQSPLSLGNLTATSFSGSVLALNTTAAPTLVAGQIYWLEMNPTNTTTDDSWNAALPGYGGSPSAYSINGGKTFMAGTQSDAFDINILVVPEPATWALLSVGALGVLLSFRRRHRPLP